jgi:CRP-like cAMP-binding protein
METLEPILAQLPFLQGLKPEHFRLLVGCARNVRFNAGEYLLREGQETNEFFIIRQGKVSLETFVPHHGSVSIQTLDSEEVVGWSWLFPPYQSHFDARAVELTRAISLDAKCLRGKCAEDHELGYELMSRFANVVVQRLQATLLQVLDVYGARPPR